MERANTRAMQKMDAKGSRSSVASKFDKKKWIGFVGDMKQEFRKIEWTSAGELKSYTKIVLISTFLFGMVVYLIDVAIQGVLGGINLLVKLFGG